MKIKQNIGWGEITLKIDGFTNSISIRDKGEAADDFAFLVYNDNDGQLWFIEGADTIEAALKIGKRAISSMYQEFKESQQS